MHIWSEFKVAKLYIEITRWEKRLGLVIIRIGRMQKEGKNIVYKVYCFNNDQGDILFFFYNSNHPCNLRGVRF